MSAAQQVAHAAHTIGWFIEGAFRPEGFDLNFGEHAKIVMAYTSVAAAKAWLDKEFEAAVAAVAGKSDAELTAPISEGPIMGGLPRTTIFSGSITDHTAHHRGASGRCTRGSRAWCLPCPIWTCNPVKLAS